MDQATIERIQRDYPAFASLLDIPDIAAVLQQASVEGWDIGKLQANVYATPWWRQHSETQRNAQILQRTDPGQYHQQIVDKRYELESEAFRLGFTLDDNELEWLATRALNEGWTPTEQQRNLAFTVRNKAIGPGTVQANASAIKAIAQQYGVNVATQQTEKLALDIAYGTQTMEGVKQYMLNQALWYAQAAGNEQILNGLQAGFTTWEILAPTLGLVAEELELPVNTLDLTEGLGHQIYNYRDPDTGQLRVMTQSEATQFARQQPEWRKTNRAGSIVSETVNAISERMGVKA